MIVKSKSHSSSANYALLSAIPNFIPLTFTLPLLLISNSLAISMILAPEASNYSLNFVIIASILDYVVSA
jgi:hypothetical protein